jgi:hypothetical protein
MPDSTIPSNRAQAKSWRDLYPVHPAADVFPLMSEDELCELGKDIKQNGLRAPIALWCDGEMPFDRKPTSEIRGTVYVLDGRNRLDAMEKVGLKRFCNRVGAMHSEGRGGARTEPDKPYVVVYDATTDPFTLGASLNVHRRHLTREQKRDVIAALLKLAPERSDRQVAKDVGADHKTVGAVRRQGEERGEIPHAEERVDTSGRSYAVVTREPYAVEAGRAAIAEADRALNELAEQQRDLADVDRRLTRAEAEVERREAAANDIPDAEVIEDAPPEEEPAAAETGRDRYLRAVEEARHRAGEPYGTPPRRPEHVEQMYAPAKEKPHPKGLGKRPNVPWVHVCPHCGFNLDSVNGRSGDADDFAAWLDGSTVAVPSLAVPEKVAA